MFSSFKTHKTHKAQILRIAKKVRQYRKHKLFGELVTPEVWESTEEGIREQKLKKDNTYTKQIQKKDSFEIVSSKGINAMFSKNRDEFMNEWDKQDGDGTTSDWNLTFGDEQDDFDEFIESSMSENVTKPTVQSTLTSQLLEGTELPPSPVPISRRKRSGSGNYLIPDA